jgi:CRISPR system Cascade subunit CasA
MAPAFNLLDEPWLPVCFTDGRVRDVGLLELFQHAAQISSLAETTPPSLVALHRLLLAITHRALTHTHGSWKDRDRAHWYREGLPKEALRDYLENWRERFWLFHPEHPFMQVAVLATAEETRDKLKPWTQISLGSSNGNTPVFFDHSLDDAPKAIPESFAVRTLLGFLQFTPGGLVKAIRDSDKAGPLANTAAVLPFGGTLNETLCLGLHLASSSPTEDLPVWERPALRLADLRTDPTLATGSNDRYTRLSRAVQFVPEQSGGIRWIHFAAGVALGDDVRAPDPMASYRAGSNTMVRLSFREGRAFWRDLPALLPDAEGKTAQPAAVLGWAANLKVFLGDRQSHQPILVAGVASDQAKLLRWRSERIALPMQFLVDPSLSNHLREEVRRAESLYEELRRLAAGMFADIMPDSRSKDTRARARASLDAGAAAATFFSVAERGLAHIMTLTAEGAIEDGYQAWSECLSHAAKKTWDILRRNLGQSPIALRAEAKAYFRFRGILSASQSATPSVAHSQEES